VARLHSRIAAIDVGSNSIHMIIAEDRGETYRVIDMEKEMVQLARGSLGGEPLRPEAIARGVAAMERMASIARKLDAEIVAVATSAVREAPNRKEFLREVETSCGVKVRVISGEEEAAYIYRAVRGAVEFHGNTALCIDIGGGSVELIVATDREVFFTSSRPLGAVRMTEGFFENDPPGPGELLALRKHVRFALRREIERVRSIGFDFVVGTSGTITTLAELAAEGGSEQAGAMVRELDRSRLEVLLVRLASVDSAGRAEQFGLDQKRADVILAGGVVLDEILAELSVERIGACGAALREGLLDRVLEERHGLVRRAAGVRHAAAIDLLDRSETDRAHAAHVARLALRIFDQTVELHSLRPRDRELLEYAAVLHETGKHVAFQGHHRHSYYIIRHSGLAGFTDEQLAIVANVARYYRKAPPSDQDESFAALTAVQKRVVSRLAAILRIAAALDRGHKQAVRDVAVEVGSKRVEFRLRARLDVTVELQSAEKRAKYFASLFERKVSFESGE
jgi:exopolyphosphatase / guanosine-5'-triphosphate,3'-diphosphate pyrophosphatase